jgi:hypothetical protein
MPAELYNALKILSVAENRSLSGQIVYALGDWLNGKVEEEQSQHGLDFETQLKKKWENMVIHEGGVSVGSVNIPGSWSPSLSPSASPSASPSPSPAPSLYSDNQIKYRDIRDKE